MSEVRPMNFKKATLVLMSLVIVMMTIACVSASDNQTNVTLGDDSPQSFQDELYTLEDTIHLSNSTYKDHDITIDRSITVEGCDETTFDGESQNALFTITNNAEVTFKNVKFINYKKQSNGAVFDVKKSSSLILINCTFTDNVMAINNLGNLEIYDSHFINNNLVNEYSHGGAISNDGTAYVENTVFTNSYGPNYSNGATLYNNGHMTLNKTTVANAYAAEDSKGSALFNNNVCLLVNSIIENNTIERYNFNYMHGTVYNQGNLTAIGNIFRNNTGKYVKPNTWYEGSPTIYNVGTLNISYNAFIDNVYFKGLSLDVFNNGARYIAFDNNWWQTNANPIAEGKLNEGNTINKWLVLNITPEYSALDFNESVLIRAAFASSDGSPIEDLLPEFDILLYDGENYSKNQLLFNKTQAKGQYTVTASVTGFSKTAIIDVGKIPVYIQLTSEKNITFPEDVFIEFSSNVNQNLTVTLNNKRYTVSIQNGKGNLTIKGLDADTYDLNVVYEGDENHFKAFNQTTITVNKMPVTLELTNITDLKTDEEMTAIIVLDPNVSPVTAQLFVNGIFNKTLYLYDSLNNLTFKNLKEGQYTITVSIAQTENYFSANATKTFNVGRYDPKLNVTVEDIDLGENATVQIRAYNFTGEVVLSINNQNRTVFINNDTNITLPNLEGGFYKVSVIFSGDSLYLPSNATATFTVKRKDPEFDVKITRNDKKAKITITTNVDCTCQVGLFVNFDKYYQNLTGGSAEFNVDLDSGTNYIFVFYEGDRNFENTTYNTTIIIDEEFLIIGEDVEGYEYNNFTYSVVLVEKNRITMPNRNVTIEFNNQAYHVMTNNDGVAGISLNLPAGTYSIKASYLNQSVTNSIKIKEIGYAISANDIEFGQSENVEVIFDSNVTGHVIFRMNGLNEDVEVINSKAVLVISNLKIGTYEINATYYNDKFVSKTVKSTFEVKRATPEFEVKTTNILPGEDETIEIKILNNFTGFIMIDVNGTSQQLEINGSKVVLNISKPGIGIYDVRITYDGNENYTGFTYSTKFAVRNLTCDIELSIGNVYYGESVVVTAKVNQTATGKITFKVSGKTQTVDIVNGQAKATFSNLNAGTYRIDAQYEGDLTFSSSETYGFFRVQKANSTVSIVTDEVGLGQNILIYAHVPVNATGQVYFSMTGYYSPRAKQISDGEAFWYISPLEAGKYTVVASYSGDANYNPSNATFTLKVSQVKSTLSVSINDVSINDRVTVNVNLNGQDGEGITGIVVLSLNKRTYNINVRNGAAKLVIARFDPGQYSFSAAFEGNDDYSTSSTSGSFIVAENLLESNLTASDVNAYYKGSQALSISLTSNGKAIAQANINVNVNNKKYTLTTDNKGNAVLNLDLNPGTYLAKITFDETLSHEASSTTAKITVSSTINATDVVKLFGTGTQYFAMFFTSDGKALGNTEVTFKLNGNTYKVKTLPNGVVRLNININPGTYKITALNPQTGEKAINTIRIYAKIMQNKDLTQYYGANKVFKVKILNATTGKAVGKGITVKFKLNKKTYTVKTDKNGYASIKIKEKPGTYTITSTYDGYKVSNKIKVKPVLTAKNVLAIKVKKIKFKAKLLNKKGKPLKGKKIKFKFRGKTYKVKTNKKGIAKLTIKNKVVKKLKSGKKYKIKSIYGKSKITNTIKIKK